MHFEDIWIMETKGLRNKTQILIFYILFLFPKINY